MQSAGCPNGRSFFAGGRSWAQIFRPVRRLKWLLFAVLVGAFGLDTLEASLENAERNYGEVDAADWEQTNVWLKSSECARDRGVWLALCGDNGRLIPISEEALGDDPGHALLLDLWAIASGEAATLVDVARLNIALNSLGFLLLASFLFAIRAYICVIPFLYLGPVVYLKWIGVSPHWGVLGVASMAAVLPMAIAARQYRFLSPRLGQVFIGLGLAGLAMASLVREAIGLMATVSALSVIVFIALRARQEEGRLRKGLVAGLSVLLASAAPFFAIAARDAVFDIEPGQLVERHGFSDILYMGLGAVPNSFGISYDDNVALAKAQEVDPDIVHCSPGFFRIMWQLYLETVLSEPAEVARIYIEKAKLILSDPILHPGPPLGVIFLIGLGHFVVATTLGLWRRIRFAPGALLEGAALVFIGLFVAQGILASPARGYAMPAGAAILALVGILLGFFGRSAWLFIHRLRS
jgi:hypothetical protein